MDCVSQAKTEAEKKECEKLLTPEAKKKLEEAKKALKLTWIAYQELGMKKRKKNARNCSPLKRKKLLEQQALDCLKNAKTDKERKKCLKDLPKDLQKKVLAKESVKAYLDCVSQAKTEAEKKRMREITHP